MIHLHFRAGRFLPLLCACLLLLSVAAADGTGTWLSFADRDAPDNLGFLVQEYTGTVTITFLGDCTLGGEEKTRNAGRGFYRTIEKNGYAYPFRNLLALTAGDDLTVANLEGVLSDRTDLKKEPKEFNFMGSAAYTEILKLGSVECVTLANNHSHDYGNAGYDDTRKALEKAGITYFGTDCLAVWQNSDALKIGFVGVSGSLSGSRGKAYHERVKLLRKLGCAAVITVMHTGTEYDTKPDGYQKQVVRQAFAAGSDLVVGHHPHVVQGYEISGGMPVVYSLGNCVFGGNTNPRDHDALAVRAELRFEEGVLAGMTLHFYPIAVSGEERYNDFSPVLLSGKDAARVLEKMKDSTGADPGVFDERDGASVTVPVR